MSRSRAPLVLGLTAAGGIGYYLYGAGGNPKVAEKQFEGMLHSIVVYSIRRYPPLPVAFSRMK